MKHATLLTICNYLCFTITAFPQCTVGVNQPAPLYSSTPGVPNAYPKFSQIVWWFPSTVCGQSSCYPNLFDSAGRNSIWASIQNWQNASSLNGSFINFSSWGSDVPPDNTSSTAYPRGYFIPYFTVAMLYNSDMPSGYSGLATSGFAWYAIPPEPASNGNLRIMAGSIAVNESVSSALITTTGTHELGHFYALEDCSTCTLGTTVMLAYLSSSSPTSPTSCDNSQAHQTAFP